MKKFLTALFGLTALAAMLPAASSLTRETVITHLDSCEAILQEIQGNAKTAIPADILHRAKRGFGTPMGAWLKKELLAVVRELLSPAVVRNRGLFRPEAIQALLADHEGNRADGTDALLALLNLEVWSRIYLDGRESADVADELRQLAAGRVAAPALA